MRNVNLAKGAGETAKKHSKPKIMFRLYKTCLESGAQLLGKQKRLLFIKVVTAETNID